MKHAMILIALLISVQLQAQGLEGNVAHGADLWHNCALNLNPDCLKNGETNVLDGNGMYCGLCHQRDRNFGLDRSRAQQIKRTSPYWLTAIFIPGLNDPEKLEDAIIKTDKGFRSVPGLTRIQTQCDAAGFCAEPLGLLQDLGNSLPDVIDGAVRQHLARNPLADTGYRLMTPQEMADTIAFLRSDFLQALATLPSEIDQ